MSEQPESSSEAVVTWFSYASSDLEASPRCLEEPVLPGQVSFHCQQAVEKAIKGLLVHLGHIRIPFTHDLCELARLATAAGGSELPATALRLLNRYSVQVRYPPIPLPTPDEADEALAIAQELVALLREQAALAESDADPQPEADI